MGGMGVETGQKGQCSQKSQGQPLGRNNAKQNLKGYVGTSQTKKVWKQRKCQAEEIEIHKRNQKQMTNM